MTSDKNQIYDDFVNSDDFNIVVYLKSCYTFPFDNNLLHAINYRFSCIKFTLQGRKF